MLYCHFTKIIKGPGTWVKPPALSQNYVSDVCYKIHQYLTKLHFDSGKQKCNFHYEAVLTIMSHILKFVDFTKTLKSRYFEKKHFFLKWKLLIINYTSQPTLLQKNSFVAEITFKLSGNSWGHLYTRFIVLYVKFSFTCGKLNLHRNIVNCKNILPLIENFSFPFYIITNNSNHWK